CLGLSLAKQREMVAEHYREVELQHTARTSRKCQKQLGYAARKFASRVDCCGSVVLRPMGSSSLSFRSRCVVPFANSIQGLTFSPSFRGCLRRHQRILSRSSGTTMMRCQCRPLIIGGRIRLASRRGTKLSKRRKKA